MALALTSQQFALLVLVALVVVAPAASRIKMVVATVGMWSSIVVPLALVTSGRAFRVALVGSGLAGTQARSLAWELHLTGSMAVEVWRLVPIVVSASISYLTHRRLGPVALTPVPLMALVATCLSLRLVFDEGLYGYYFMAVAVSLIISGRPSSTTPSGAPWLAGPHRLGVRSPALGIRPSHVLRAHVDMAGAARLPGRVALAVTAPRRVSRRTGDFEHAWGSGIA